ncbi:MAG: GNAT family N-acetyltransferase [Planctomycetota bacterium]
MEIREIKDRDIELLAKQIINVLNAPPYGEHWTPKIAAKYLRTLLSYSPNDCFCAVNNNKVVGAIFYTVRPYYLGNYAVIEEIFIEEKNRRKGYGKKLLEESISQLKKRGVNGVTWKAKEDADTYSFGKKMGFTDLSEWKFLIKMLA